MILVPSRLALWPSASNVCGELEPWAGVVFCLIFCSYLGFQRLLLLVVCVVDAGTCSPCTKYLTDLSVVKGRSKEGNDCGMYMGIP